MSRSYSRDSHQSHIERRVTRTQPNGSGSGNEHLCPPNLKSRKWKKEYVKMGANNMLVPQWVPDVPEVTKALQQYNTTKDNKIANVSKIKSRKRTSISSEKRENSRPRIR